MKFKKIMHISILTLTTITPIVLTSCATTNNNHINQEKNENKIDLNKITSINKESFKNIWSKHPTLFQNNILNLSYLPNLTKIEDNTFMFDRKSTNIDFKISKIIFNEKLEIIGNNVFKDIQSLIYLKLPKTIKSIGDHSFDNAFTNGFSRVVFNQEHISLNNLGKNSFLNNKNLNLFIINNQTLKIKFEQSKDNIGYTNTILSDDLDSSGQIGNLQISKFLPIVSLLELTNKTRLSSLTNQILNEKIKNNSNIQSNEIYKNTKFEIQENSSEANGNLKLKIIIPNIKLKNNDDIIDISGFNKINFKNMYLSSVKINSYNYFNDLQKEQNLEKWTDQDWKKYLSEINIKTKDSIESFDFSDESQSSNINLNFKYSNNSNKHKLYLIAKAKNHIYKNGQWIDDGNTENNEEIKGLDLKPINFELPNNKKDLYEFLNKKIYINNTETDKLITNLYPSKYLADFNLGIKTWSNSLLKIDTKYLDYAKELNVGKINIEALNVYPNDIDGTLDFNYKIKDEEEIHNQYLYLNSYRISGFKKIENLVQANPSILVKSESNVVNNFIKTISRIKTKTDLEKLCQEKGQLEIPNPGINGFGNQATQDNNTKSIILNNIEYGEEENSKQFNSSYNKYEFVNSIFMGKQLIESNIDFKTNFFNEEFIINNLFFTTNIKDNAKLIGINENTLKCEINIMINLILNKNSINNDNVQEFNISGKLSLTLQLNKFNNMKNK